MKKNKIDTYILLILSSLLIFVSSCKKDEDATPPDTTKPIISMIEPLNGDTLHIGESIHFECDFSDNLALKSYKIEFHINTDGHVHTKSNQQLNTEEPWIYNNSWMFEEGKKEAHIHHHEIVIPDSIAGKPTADGDYHLGIYCTDISGNEQHVFVDVKLAYENGDGHTHK